MVYDLIIIGGGPAGYTAGVRAGRGGLKTLLIEKEHIGGVCLNKGCIPTKTLLYSAKLKDGAEHGAKYGVSAQEIVLDHAAVIKRKNKIVRKLTAGVKAQVLAANTEILDGRATITGKTPEGFSVQVNDTQYSAKRLLLATGSSPSFPPIPGLESAMKSGLAVTSDEILNLAGIPGSLVIIGGGVIGMEMASYFNSAGSNVTVIEMLPQIGGPVDTDIAALLQKNYESKGVRFLLSSRVTAVGEGSVEFEQAGVKNSVNADMVLLSTGRSPDTKGLGIENLGIAAVRGAVQTDERCMTNVQNVYAAGDINGKSMLAHTAYREAEVAVSNMLGIRDTMRYDSVPSVIYTNPEVASVGYTLEGAQHAGMDVSEHTLSMNFSGRYMAENEGGNGILKIIADNKAGCLRGVHMIGNYSSEIIVSAGMMIEKMMGIDDIKKLIFPHPTVGEVIREAVFEI